MAYTHTQTAYAKRLGITQARVSKYISQGLLDGAIKKKGKRWFIDPDKADEVLPQRLSPIASTKIKPKKKTKTPTVEEKREKITAANIKNTTYHEARTLNEQYKAALKALEYKQRIAELIPAKEIEAVWSSHILSAKVKILGIKSKVAPLIKEFLEEVEYQESILKLIDSCAREALDELSNYEL